jgi:hypothetical protein
LQGVVYIKTILQGFYIYQNGRRLLDVNLIEQKKREPKVSSRPILKKLFSSN